MKLATAIVLATCTNAVEIRFNDVRLPCQPTDKLTYNWGAKELRLGDRRFTGKDPNLWPWPALQYPPGAVLITGREVPLFRSGFE